MEGNFFFSLTCDLALVYACKDRSSHVIYNLEKFVSGRITFLASKSKRSENWWILRRTLLFSYIIQAIRDFRRRKKSIERRGERSRLR